MLYVVPIVEGHGEVKAVPTLIHRIVNAHAPSCACRVNEPIRVKAGQFLNKPKEFNRHILLAAAKAAQAVPDNGLVLILLDCEDDCPATIGPELLSRAQAVRSDVSYLVVLATREYESWFLAAARSLCGVSGLTADLEPPVYAENIRNAKGWLSSHMPTNSKYDEITHQIEMTRHFNLEEALANASFARLYTRLCAILSNLDSPCLPQT